MDRGRFQISKDLKHLVVVWDGIVAAATLQAVLFFGSPFDVVGSSVDMRFMLWFAVLGVLGAICLTIASCGRISAFLSTAFFVVPGFLSLYWGQLFFSQDTTLSLFVMLGLPVLAYAGGFAVSIYIGIKQIQMIKSRQTG